PDLSAAVWSLDLRSSLPPEDLLLLKEWVRAAFSRELGQLEVRWFPKVCEKSFLCVSAAPQDGPAISAALGKVLSSLPTDLFYSSRALAAKNAEEWDRSSADWKLHTAARTFGRNSAARTALERAAAPDNQALASLVKRESG